jgi:hypothetical protein
MVDTAETKTTSAHTSLPGSNRTSDDTPGPSSATRLTDWLFSRMVGDGRTPWAAGPTPGVLVGPAWADVGTTQPPPAIPAGGDLRAAYEWLQRERRRLEGYTQSQLALLQREHQAMVQQSYLNEAALIARSQELGRQEEMLAAQSRALQQQALELSRREQGMAGQLDEWRRLQEELAANEQLSSRARQDAEAQVAALESLRAETASLQRAREAARADLEALAVALTRQREARAKEQALFAAGRAELEARLQAADRAEAAARRRQAEMDELEARLFAEIEEQHRLLADERRALEARQAALRGGDRSREAQLEKALRQLFAILKRRHDRLEARAARLAHGPSRLPAAAPRSR